MQSTYFANLPVTPVHPFDLTAANEWPLPSVQSNAMNCCYRPEVASVATKGILDRQRPELLAMLRIFTEQNLTAGILGRRHDQRFVDG
jgi:hypothetical protein